MTPQTRINGHRVQVVYPHLCAKVVECGGDCSSLFSKKTRTKKNQQPTTHPQKVGAVVSVQTKTLKICIRNNARGTPIRQGLRFGLRLLACIYVYYPPDIYF